MAVAITKAMQPQASHVHTLTCDNGKEFAFHQHISNMPDAEGFFAHPCHSWERGLNENTNGLIRQYLPKGKAFHELAGEDVHTIMNRLNKRPGKYLGFKTTNQAFCGRK